MIRKSQDKHLYYLSSLQGKFSRRKKYEKVLVDLLPRMSIKSIFRVKKNFRAQLEVFDLCNFSKYFGILTNNINVFPLKYNIIQKKYQIYLRCRKKNM